MALALARPASDVADTLSKYQPLFAGPVFQSEEVPQQSRQLTDDHLVDRSNERATYHENRLPPISSFAHTSVAYQDYSLAPSPTDRHEPYQSVSAMQRPRSPQRAISGGCGGSSSCGSTPNAYQAPHQQSQVPKQEPQELANIGMFDYGAEQSRSRSVERDMEDLLGGGAFGASFLPNGGSGSYVPSPTVDGAHQDASPTASTASPGAEGDDDKGTDIVTPFISKLSHLLSHSDYTEFIRWNTNGDSFIFAHTSPDLLDIFARYDSSYRSHEPESSNMKTLRLRRFFRHSNVHSFVRQLSPCLSCSPPPRAPDPSPCADIYGFTRLSTLALLSAIDSVSYPHSSLSASDFSGFSHPLFWRERPGNPCDLTRIKPKVTKTKSTSSGAKKDSKKRKATATVEAAGTGGGRQPSSRRKA